ncbi:hypothetical protein, partial [Limnoraphis robusta]
EKNALFSVLGALRFYMAKAFLARTPYLKFSRLIASIRCWVFQHLIETIGKLVFLELREPDK